MSLIASRASAVSVPGSMVRNSRPPARSTPMPSVVANRYSVWLSRPNGSTSVCRKTGVTSGWDGWGSTLAVTAGCSLSRYGR